MSYVVDGGIWSSVFAVPTAVVDEHIRMCSPISLKILLMMLRNSGTPVDIPWLSGQLRLPPADIADAINYWVGAGIISDSDAPPQAATRPEAAPQPQALSGTLQPPPEPAKAIQETVSEPTGQKILTISARPKISRADVASMVKTDSSLFQLLREAQNILQTPLTPVDSEILTALHTYYKLPSDVVLMLLQYCASSGKTSMHSVEKMAASWLDRDITTHERAEQEILRLTANSENDKKIISAFRIQGRGLSARERDFAAQWFTMGLDEKLICYACESTIDKTGKASFAYADKMLTSWKSKGVSTIQEAVAEQKANAGKYAQQQAQTARTAGSSIDKNALDALIDKQFSG